MRVATKDPITGNDVADRDAAPFVVEGQGHGTLKIYFESEESKQEYLDILPRKPEECSLRLYTIIEENETILWD